MITRFCLGFLLGLTLWTAAPTQASAAEPPSAVQSAQGPDRQVLVFLRLPPPHLGPGGDYGDAYHDASGLTARRRVASGLARAHGLSLVDEWPLPLLGVDCFIMAVPAQRSVAEEVERLAKEPGVAWSQPVGIYQAQGASGQPNDPLFRVQPAAGEWRLADLHRMATGHKVLVAVVDSMIETTHPDLAGQIQINHNFVLDRPNAPERHGTGVAGIIAARADNGLGIVGVAPRARLMALRACWQTATLQGGAPSTVCDSVRLAEAIHFAIEHKAQVINLSLSGPPDPLLHRLIDIALARGITVVAAYDGLLPNGGFPASQPGVVAVANDWPRGALTGVYSAPGRDVPTTQPGGRWYLVNGSSYSAAHVSGLFALLREHAPGAKSGAFLVAERAGGGEIDACASVLRTVGPCACTCAHEAKLSTVARH